MTLRLFDTDSRTVRDFEPLIPGHVSIYLCGATVQGEPHIGHVRSGVAFDILRRWLIAKGNDVAFVRNVTDIDDKILNKAADAGRPWWEWAATYERAFQRAYDLLGVMPPSCEPRATGHIPQMIEYMREIIEHGHGYAADGNVYLDVKSIPDYGHLSGQKLDELHQGESAGEGKRDQRDFTLWKAAKPGEPSWDTPWGPGRPGWHLECSAMARDLPRARVRYPLRWPRLGVSAPRERDRAGKGAPETRSPATGCTTAGSPWAARRCRSRWAMCSPSRTSSSESAPQELRFYLGSANYRSMLEYSDAALEMAAKSYQGIEAFVNKVAERAGTVELGDWTDEFAAALDDDLVDSARARRNPSGRA